MNWKILIGGGVVLAPLFWVLAQGFGVDPHAVPFALGGEPAPEFELATLTGEKVRLSDYRGKPVVINFWSTWCEPCKAEHDLLQQGSAFYGEDVVFLGVLYQDTPEAASAYLSERSNRFPHLLDPETRVGMDFGVSGVPESFFIDAKGRIRHKEAGVVSGSLLKYQLSMLLGEAARGASR